MKPSLTLLTALLLVPLAALHAADGPKSLPIALAASWPLDEVADTLVVRGNAQTAVGVAGKSVVLNGESLIELKDSEKFASGEFTVSLWFNPYDLAGGQQMLAGKNRYSRNERQWSLTIEPDGKLKAHLRQNDWSTIPCAAPLIAGRWHLATLVADAQMASLYLNGKLVGEVKLASPSRRRRLRSRSAESGMRVRCGRRFMVRWTSSRSSREH